MLYWNSADICEKLADRDVLGQFWFQIQPVALFGDQFYISPALLDHIKKFLWIFDIKNFTFINEMELIVSEPEDMKILLDYMMEGTR